MPGCPTVAAVREAQPR